MKQLFYILLFLASTISIAQNSIQLVASKPLDATIFWGVDQFQNEYYSKKNTLYKHTESNTYNYKNMSYGKLTAVDFSNPLKVVLFYEDFNTVLILDNRLNLTDLINFESNITFACKGNTNEIRVFNSDTQTLQNYNFKTNTITSSSLPFLQKNVFKIKGNLNNLLLQTEKNIKQFDYLGSFLKDYPFADIDDFQLQNQKFYFSKKGKLYVYNQTDSKELQTNTTETKQFFLTDRHLYVFNGSNLFHFIIDKN